MTDDGGAADDVGTRAGGNGAGTGNGDNTGAPAPGVGRVRRWTRTGHRWVLRLHRRVHRAARHYLIAYVGVVLGGIGFFDIYRGRNLEVRTDGVLLLAVAVATVVGSTVALRLGTSTPSHRWRWPVRCADGAALAVALWIAYRIQSNFVLQPVLIVSAVLVVGAGVLAALLLYGDGCARPDPPSPTVTREERPARATLLAGGLGALGTLLAAALALPQFWYFSHYEPSNAPPVVAVENGIDDVESTGDHVGFTVWISVENKGKTPVRMLTSLYEISGTRVTVGREPVAPEELLAQRVDALAHRIRLAVQGGTAQAHADDLGLLGPGGPLHAGDDPGLGPGTAVGEDLADSQVRARCHSPLLAVGGRARPGDRRGDVRAVPAPVGDVLAGHEAPAADDALLQVRVAGVDSRVEHGHLLAKLHGKVRRQRLDHAHKTALRLVREHDLIAHEDLKIRNMGKAPTPKPDPNTPGGFLPNGAAAKAGLNHSINDAGWGVFLTMFYGPGWSVATPTRHSEKPSRSRGGGVTRWVPSPAGRCFGARVPAGPRPADSGRNRPGNAPSTLSHAPSGVMTAGRETDDHEVPRCSPPRRGGTDRTHRGNDGTTMAGDGVFLGAGVRIGHGGR